MSATHVKEESRYRSRYPKGKYKKLIDDLLSELEELREATDPTGGQCTAAGKDARAFQALRSAAVLTNVVAGWAIDHQIGLALTNCEQLPRVHPKINKSPDYSRLGPAVDTHEHEEKEALLP